MAQAAEFEEKEYEQPLNFELLSNPGNNIWSPGQVFEEHFGIDVALNVDKPDFWKLFGHINIPAGAILDSFNWGYIWRKIKTKRMLPNFQTNLLLQVKRSHHRIGRKAIYAAQGITGQYWQFEITDHQQHALDKLHQKLSNRALVCYASPAFHTLAELYDNIRMNSLVENTSFVQVHRMTGHKRWVYDQAGAVGLACSKIEKIEDQNFRSLINNIDSSSNDGNTLSNLLVLESAVIECIAELDQENPIAREFNRRIFNIQNAETIAENSNLLAIRAYVNFSTFCNLTNFSWFVI